MTLVGVKETSVCGTSTKVAPSRDFLGHMEMPSARPHYLAHCHSYIQASCGIAISTKLPDDKWRLADATTCMTRRSFLCWTEKVQPMMTRLHHLMPSWRINCINFLWIRSIIVGHLVSFCSIEKEKLSGIMIRIEGGVRTMTKLITSRLFAPQSPPPLSVAGLASAQREGRWCGQTHVLEHKKKEKAQNHWKLKVGGMDFSQYFWPVPSRLDELSGGVDLHRQGTVLETFLVNSLQVEMQQISVNYCHFNWSWV